MPPIEQESTISEIVEDELHDDLGFDTPALGNDDIDVVIVDGEGDGGTPPIEGETPPAEGGTPPIEGETPPAEGEEDPLEAELEATDKAYPEPIKKRIKREIRLRKRVEAEFEQVRDAAIEVARVAQSSQQELVQAKESLRKLRIQHAEVLNTTFDKEIQIKSAQMRKARDDSDFDTEVKLQSELDTLRFQQNQVREARRSLGEETPPADGAAGDPRAGKPATPAAPAGRPAQPAAPRAVKWVDANKAWFRNPKFAGQTSFVLGVDAQLTKEGYDKNTVEYYAELDRRIDEVFPTLRKAPASTDPVAPTGGNRGGTPRVNGGKKTITLTKDDLNNMRKYGLDPTNKQHLQEYARNKVTS